MNFFNFFTQKEKKEGFIGKFECSVQRLPELFSRLMETMGMANPVNYTQNAAKAVTIKKNGDKYTIFINTYNPPLQIEWTEEFPTTDLVKVINRLLVKKGKKVAYINTNSSQYGGDVCQFAVA